MTDNEKKHTKIINAYIQKRLFNSAISHLVDNYGVFTAHVYNTCLYTLLREMVISLGAQGAYMTTDTYNKFMKLPSYRMCEKTLFPLTNKNNIRKNYELQFK